MIFRPVHSIGGQPAQNRPPPILFGRAKEPCASSAEKKKCAPSHINNIDMLTQELKEKKKKLLHLIQDDVAQIGLKQDLLLPEVKNLIARSLFLLECDKRQDAWLDLWSAYQRLIPAPNVNSLAYFSRIEYRDKLGTELAMLDLGIFAYRLEGSFFQLHDVVHYLWEARKNFHPHLSDALKAIYWFICLIEAGHKIEEALSKALSVRNELSDAFSDIYIYHGQSIDKLLNPDALASLRQILLCIYSQRQAHGK
jgi:hypothetical protein